MKIAYQGIRGSFSEVAAIKLAKQIGITEYELNPLTTSENVCQNVDDELSDYGVVAIKNSIGGEVRETKIALNQRSLVEVARASIPISQCIFKFSNDISINEIDNIASHEQALRQCNNTINSIFGNVKRTTIEDTALAAKRLKEKVFDSNTAVICSKRAGELNALSLIQEGAQDKEGNTTYFVLLSK